MSKERRTDEQDPRAIEISKLYAQAEAVAANFRSLYQDIADLMYPRENQIITVTHEGEERNVYVYDPTAQMAKDEMAAGLSSNLFPAGQEFHEIRMVEKELNDIPVVKQWLGIVNEIIHQRRAASNFRVEADENLKSIATFGTGNIFSEYKPGIGLHYKHWDIGQYVIIENNLGLVDQVLMKFNFTPRQAYAEWGEAIGPHILTMLEDPKKADFEKVPFIIAVRPRTKRNRRLTDRMNMPFGKICINDKEKLVVKEGGYEEFPHFVSRWSKSANETWGRGQGVTALPVVRRLQQEYSDLLECAEKWNNPPREVLNEFDGVVKVKPGATNWVNSIPSIRAIDDGVRGNFVITTELLEMERQTVQRLFLNDLFMPITPLKGDRRNEMEIAERINESFKRIGSPVGRQQEEWIKPMIERDVFLLLRNGELPPIPEQIQGRQFKIMLLGPLAMQLQNSQAQGVLRWMAHGAELKQHYPGIDDVIRIDSAFRRIGESLGVSVEDMATDEEVQQKRQTREEQLAREQAMKMAETAGKAYGPATKAPEPGSPAEELIGA